MASARRIDVHFHIIPEFYQEIVRAAGLGPARRAGYPPYSPELAIEVMDANEIAVGLTSVAQPGVHFAAPAEAKTLARKLNDHASELKAKWPQRFGALATIPMRDIADAVAEVEHALDVLKHDGVSLFASYGEQFLGDPAFDPVMEALNRRKAAVFIHPTLHPSSKALSLKWPAYIMEYLFDTTRAVGNLILGGTIERYPEIRFILPHAGGTLPYFGWRFASTPVIDPTMPQWSREDFAAKLRHFWYDIALSSGPTTMGALKTVADPGKIVFGSDWPFVQAPLVAEALAMHTAPGLHSEAERAAIDRGNALKLFPQFA
jgi:predicted TIM-barrel fold metal-dependent hydrolase